MLPSFSIPVRNIPLVLRCIAFCLLALSLIAIRPSARADDSEKLQWFEKKIRPALIEHCQDCHAVDSESSGGLLLDSRDGWQAGGDSGAAIVPGKPAESLLFKAISYEDPELQMPPDGKLPAEVSDAFRQWIYDGAIDPRRGEGSIERQSGLPVDRAQEHWSYRPIRPLPEELASASDWIDRLIELQLREAEYEPLEKASERVLVRRLYFDLTGLPPTKEQLDAYLRSTASNRYDQLVDELLESPRFGEHFARKWMDVVRYADSITLRGFVLPEAWRYRDYLIEAFNADRPFDQMVIEQVAGDMLPREGVDLLQRQRQVIATGFLALGNTNLERQDKTQLDMDHIDEQLQVLGRAFLGQTIGCARCHDHKFDPIPTADYYALAGIFRSAKAMDHANVSKWIETPLPVSEEEESRRKVIQDQITASQKQLQAKTKLLSKMEQIANQSQIAPGIVVDDIDAKLVGSWRASQSVTGYIGKSYLVAEMGVATEPLQAIFSTKFKKAGEYEVRVAFTPNSNRTSKAKYQVQHSDGTSEVVVDQRKLARGESWFSLGKFQFDKGKENAVTLFASNNDGAVIADAVNWILYEKGKAVPSRKATSKEDLVELEGLRQEVKSLEAERDSLQSKLSPQQKYLTVRETGKVRNIPVHIRGDVHNLGGTVPRGFLTAVKPSLTESLSDESSGRLELARWLVADQNPLSARVYANRVWLWLMGRGLVSTPNNFGTTGQAPTHPELLDGLAMKLKQSAWSTKALVKSIVLSDAYQRQSSPAQRVDGGYAEMEEMDPQNSLYWRAARRRLGVEAMRDAMLSVSGEIAHKIGGSLIKSGTKADYNYKHEGARRAVYQPVFRNSLPELYEAFDFADTSVSIGERPRSTVATQGLVLMNHPWVVARAKKTAKRIMAESRGVESESEDQAPSELGDAERIRLLYLRCFGREPDPKESSLLLGFLQTDGTDTQELEKRWTQVVHSMFASLDFRYLE